MRKSKQTHYIWIHATVLSTAGEKIEEVVRKRGLDRYPSLSD